MRPPAADAPCGRLAGDRVAGVLRFRGVRYASAPVGPLRWRPPVPLAPTGGVRDCRHFVAAPQPRAPGEFGRVFPVRGERDEDCLALNVWTPDLRGRAPVLVWLHGGGFEAGGGGEPDCDGTALASGGLVVVTVNYRLGALALGGLALEDQLAALAWVRDNVAALGGDPERVTLAGSSAGAMSIACLLRRPEARGLFRAAILQSGAAAGVSPEVGARVAALVRRELADPAAAPVAAVLAAQATVTPEARALLGDEDGLGMVFQPVVSPAPLAVEVPVIIGTTADEWALFSGLGTGDASEDAARTERVFRRPALDLATALARAGVPVWLYRFAWRPHPADDTRGLGACHGIEIPFVFDTFACATGRALAPGGARSATRAAVRSAWGAFVECADPGPGWPRHDPDRGTEMVFA
jgi:para-nitrobenzyl esterase